MHRMTELRPAAPLDDVRFVRVHMVHPVDQKRRVHRLLRGAGLRGRQAPAARRLRLRPEAARRRARPPPSTPRAASRATSPIRRYEWDLDGNGTLRDRHRRAQPFATKAYGETGRYNVGLRVTDADGEQDEFRAARARGARLRDLRPRHHRAGRRRRGGARSRTARAAPSPLTMGHSGETDPDARLATGAARRSRSTCCPATCSASSGTSTTPTSPSAATTPCASSAGRRRALERQHADAGRHAGRLELDRRRPQRQRLGGRLGVRRATSARAATSSAPAIRWSTSRRRPACPPTSARP